MVHVATSHLPASSRPAASPRKLWAGQWLLGVAAALAAALAASGLFAADRMSRGSTEVATGAEPATTGAGGDAATPAASGAEAYYDLGGATPAAFPATRLGVGFLTLDDPFDKAAAALGPPASTFPDIGGTASTWQLGDAQLTVGAWGEGDRRSISSLHAGVPEGSPVRVSAFGAVIGASTLAEVVGA